MILRFLRSHLIINQSVILFLSKSQMFMYVLLETMHAVMYAAYIVRFIPKPMLKKVILY